MAVEFYEDGHIYKSVDVIENISWISVTSLISQFKEPFNGPNQALSSSRNRKSKWYKLPVEEILEVWQAETIRSNTLGTWYHKERETDLMACETIERYGKDIPIFKPIYENGIKIASEQRLVEGIYPEHLVYSKVFGVCGQVDRADVINWILDIDDYKTNKEIKKASYRNWEGSSKRLMSPLLHLEDCHVVHYGLQLSMYAYMIIKHNPQISVGKLNLKHVIFEEEGRDKYDNPITKLDHNKNPIVKEVVPIQVPYYKREVELIFDWLKNNRDKIRKKT